MPLIHFVKGLDPLPAPAGGTLMEALVAGGRPVASSCRGDGVCGKCRVRVLNGAENLEPENDLERRKRSEFRLTADQRLSCQARVRGDVTVDASYW